MTDLDQRIAVLEALDKERTQGDWIAMTDPAPSYSDHGYRRICSTAKNAAKNVYTNGAKWTDQGWSFGTDADAEFIAAAPEMMSVIRELKAERDALLKFAPIECPYCPDQGWYVVNNEQIQCEFCYSNPRSIFNSGSIP